jgi:hypothetical protein
MNRDIVNSGRPIQIISSQSKDKRLDWLKRSLMESYVAGECVY